MRSFSKSMFPGLLKNVLTFNPMWLEGRMPPNYREHVGRFPKQELPVKSVSHHIYTGFQKVEDSISQLIRTFLTE